MKNIKTLIFGIALLAGYSTSAMAEGVTWTLIHGIRWSNVIYGTYQNLDLDGTTPRDGVVQKTKATEACRYIGGQLPTKENYETLGSAFKKLPEMKEHWFWTASVNPMNPNTAYFFDGNGGSGDVYFDRRSSEWFVRCVQLY